MRRARWLAPWKDNAEQPSIYHCVTRVVGRDFVFGPEEKEKFRTFMRMYENFSGCRVLSYCLMSNHVHILLEVPPMPEGGLTDAGLLKRLRAIYSELETREVEKQLARVRKAIVEGRADESLAREIHERFTYRMHDLGNYMKNLLGRYTQWFNNSHQRTGTLWEGRFKSVLVEDGVAARTMAAYIDLNPVRAGMVEDPALYRWSSYGEAMGGGAKGNGAKARAGLVRALGAHKGWAADGRHWPGRVSREYRMLLLDEGMERTKEVVDEQGRRVGKVVRKGMKREVTERELEELERSRDVALAKVVRYRVRYFSDGAVLGSRDFVNGVFEACRWRFGPRRKNGARPMGGAASGAKGVLWSARDLRVGVEG
ncbi:MAG: transposase [Akkermansiaceae bacterium]|nr:transposase [Akkermansiaceae bacterium]